MITFAKTENYKRWVINDYIVILSLTLLNEKTLEILPRSYFADLKDLPIYYERDIKDLIMSIFKAEKITRKI